MDICFLPAWFFDIENNGGGLFFKEQAIAMQSVVENCSIFYPALGFSYSYNPKWEKQTTEGITTFKYQRFSFPKRISSLRFLYDDQIIKAFSLFLTSRNGRLPDLIHAHSLWGGYAALLIKKKWGVPFVYTEHLGKWTDSGYYPPRHQLKSLQAIMKMANLVTAVSTSLAHSMKAYCGDASILVTPNMVDTDFFTPLTGAKKKQPDTFRIISIGDPWYTKGLDLLIEATGIAQQQTEVKLQLTLVDKIPKRQQLYPIIKKHQLEKQVDFTGRLERGALKRLLQQQDVLVSASRRESFGITMIEALACGVPVIATPTAGASDIIKPHCGILLSGSDAEHLANGIINMVDKSRNYDTNTLVDYAKSNYGKAAFSERWEQIYSTILN